MEQGGSPALPVVWGNLTDKNVNQLQRLNATIFPVKYNDMFYTEAVKAPDGFVRLAYYNELLVGAVCCRKEWTVAAAQGENDNAASNAADPENASLYILTLGVLAPYRERGIGKQLISHVLDLVESSPACSDVADVYLHVQEGNEDALRFYKNYGFEVSDKLPNYYKRIEPAACYIVRKTIKNR